MAKIEKKEQILKRLVFLYGTEKGRFAFEELEKKLEARPVIKASQKEKWTEKDVFAITYGDTFKEAGRTPLNVLNDFLGEYVGDKLSFLHLLPFYPYTSDDGFSVVDYRQVDSNLGSWEDVSQLSQNYKLVFDGVINHVSCSSDYMQEQCKGNEAFKDFIITLDPKTDTSLVTRPRNLPLLHEFETVDGPKWFWTTFSRDQVDLNFKNPYVLIEIIDVLLFYAQQGAKMIRLDAIPFLWKELGTNCSHLPQTHEVIKLIRDVINEVSPDTILLSETNVPHKENISYFGNKGDEAQIIYNFSLPPLILFSLTTGQADKLTQWAQTIEKIGDDATYLNITATHDGIGVRPTEGILSNEERQMLVDLARKHGGAVNEKVNPDGSVSPYELNVTYFDAINNPKGSLDVSVLVDRFLLSQLIPLSFIGIPGIYIHSLIGSRNDYEGVKETGAPRSINRKKLDYSLLKKELDDKDSLRAQVLKKYLTCIEIRKSLTAFHPNAEQEVLDWGKQLFVNKRMNKKTGETVLAVHNVADTEQVIQVETVYPSLLNGKDVLSETDKRGEADWVLAPYQVSWIKL